MLRIKTQDTPHRIVLKLEGDLCGVEVCEFLSAWREARRALNGRALLIDLGDTGRIDRAGEYLLALVRCHGSQLIGSGLLIGSLIEAITRDWPFAETSTNQQVQTGR